MLLRTKTAALFVPRTSLVYRLPQVQARQNHSSTAVSATLGWLDPLARHMVSFPEYMGLLDVGLAYPYTYSVVALTMAMRSFVSIPLAIWQHRRNDRYAQVVLPEWRAWQKQIPANVIQQHQPADGEQVSMETKRLVSRKIQRRLSEKWNRLIALYHCSPARTMMTSLALHIPLFVLMMALLRQGAVLPGTPFAQELIPWWTPDQEFAAHSAATRQILLDKGLDPGLADRLTKLGGPTLADRDPTYIMPLICGSLNMVNVELTAWTRQQRRVRESAMGLSTENEADLAEEPPRARILSNFLRVGAILSIPIACQVPSVLLVCWSTSSLMTLAMNSYFARRSSKI